MKTGLFSFILFVSLLSLRGPERKIRILMAGDSTMSVKETTAYPETGWGMPFQYFWDSTVEVINLAKNGRSTRTFISEGRWEKLMEQVRKGDYVFIEFGHNDESKEKPDRYTTVDEYRANLSRFVDEVRSRNAIPVLLTPVSRRKFESEGQVTQTHPLYSTVVRELAAAKKVTFIDLDELTRKLYERFGPEWSRQLFLHLRPGEHPNYPSGREDNTHFNELGARLVAQEVLTAIQGSDLELKDHIIKSKRP
ncbi:MAG: rhamnogalacturonan acetylesterase [Chitinophagaceae bacterium]